MLGLLINLDDSTDRLTVAQGIIAREGLSVTRFPATDGRGRPTSDYPTYDESYAIRFYGRPMTAGEIGCYMSHLRCVEAFLASDAELCLVLEDDMTMPEGAGHILSELQGYLGSKADLDWDVINLGMPPKKFMTRLTGFGDTALYHAYYFPVTTTALLWSRQGAEAFWATRDKIYAPVDHFFRRFFSVRGTGLALSPALIVPSGAESLIDAEGTAGPTTQKARKRISRTPLYFWREFKRQSVNYIGAIRGTWRTRRKGQ